MYIGIFMYVHNTYIQEIFRVKGKTRYSHHIDSWIIGAVDPASCGFSTHTQRTRIHTHTQRWVSGGNVLTGPFRRTVGGTECVLRAQWVPWCRRTASELAEGQRSSQDKRSQLGSIDTVRQWANLPKSSCLSNPRTLGEENVLQATFIIFIIFILELWIIDNDVIDYNNDELMQFLAAVKIKLTLAFWMHAGQEKYWFRQYKYQM